MRLNHSHGKATKEHTGIKSLFAIEGQMSELTQEEQTETTSTSQSGPDANGEPPNTKVMTLGLVPSPGLAQRVAGDIAEDLTDYLSKHIDSQVTWKVTIVPDPLTGSDVEAPALLEEVHERLKAAEWDYAICLTDLPVRRSERIIVADVSISRGIAWLSLPALGVIRHRSRVRAAILQLMSELRWGRPRGEEERHERHATPSTDESDEREHTPDQLIGAGVAQEVTPSEEHMNVDLRYVAPRVIGHARLLTGMVYANRPWRLFPSFKATVATAFATGVYGMIFTTLWELGNTYTMPRLAILTLISMAILIGWIVISHRLWQPHRASTSQYLTTLYNTATVLTISTGVVVAYASIFLLLLLAATFFIPESMLESTLDRSITPINYVNIAWVTASVATIAGAVGAGLEDTEAVREATFGWRQRRRYEAYQQANGDN